MDWQHILVESLLIPALAAGTAWLLAAFRAWLARQHNARLTAAVNLGVRAAQQSLANGERLAYVQAFVRRQFPRVPEWLLDAMIEASVRSLKVEAIAIQNAQPTVTVTPP